jgi:squalene-hopene/tetraprenyl-beta-curcumene cyclase
MTRPLCALLAGVACAALAVSAEKEAEYNPGKIRSDEPAIKSFSKVQARKYLDHVGAGWTTNRKCATCHTNVPYLMAGPSMGPATEKEKMVRKWFEGRAENWDRKEKGDAPKTKAEVMVVGVTLAYHDAKTTGKLSTLARKALDRMWTLQKPSGEWVWDKCKWPPLEHDDYYGAVYVAVGVGQAPDGYASTEKAKAGLAKLRAYLKKNPAPTLHHKAWLLWASQKVDGLMTKDEQAETVKKLKALQKADGGWSLPSLGEWEGFDGRDNNTKAGSDGYGTGLVVFILRQAGVKVDDPAIKKGVAWLKANQRQSGRWFTQSVNTDRFHYISNAGTAFAVMAIKACE